MGTPLKSIIMRVSLNDDPIERAQEAVGRAMDMGRIPARWNLGYQVEQRLNDGLRYMNVSTEALTLLGLPHQTETRAPADLLELILG